jgi:two-component system, LytTR family, response regulator AgrA
MKLNFILADDREDALKSTENYVKKLIEDKDINGEIIMSSTDPQKVVDYSSHRYDEINIYILDINFNTDLNGIMIAREIREREPYAYIIFLTAHVQLSMLTFKYKLKVFDFLIKPVSYNDLADCIVAVQEDLTRIFQYDIPESKMYIDLKSGYRDYHIQISDIIFVESFGSKLIIHMSYGEIETYSTLRELEAMLSELSTSFHRSHKSYIVNLEYVEYVDFQSQEILMSTGDICLLSRTRKTSFKELMENSTIKQKPDFH